MLAQSPATHSVSHEFEVASVKPTVPDWQGGAYFTMRGGHEFVVKNYTLKSLVAAAWDLPTRLISGGTAWITVDLTTLLPALRAKSLPVVTNKC